MDYDLLTYIGRFQPFHNGHKRVIDAALTRADRVAIVIGSHDKPRDVRDPWTSSERAQMIGGCFSTEEQKRLVFVPQVDHTYNLERWLGGVESSVYATAFSKWKPDAYKIGIIGVEKDWTSFYLNHFPQWDRIPFDPGKLINATDIRKMYFDMMERDIDWMKEVLPLHVVNFLNNFADTQECMQLANDSLYITDYHTKWGPGPHLTGDMLVVQAANILLIRRGPEYGGGLLALPGGFVKENETVLDGAIRELYEETDVAIGERSVLRPSIIKSQLFDAPGRSQRGRIVTTCFLARIHGKDLPKIKGGDDATEAMWVSPGTLKRSEMFEDHFDIIEAML